MTIREVDFALKKIGDRQYDTLVLRAKLQGYTLPARKNKKVETVSQEVLDKAKAAMDHAMKERLKTGKYKEKNGKS